MRNNVVKIIGIEGLLLLLFGLMALLFAPAARFISLIFFAAGGIGILVYIALGWKVLKSSSVSRSAKIGVNAATYTLIVLAIIVLTNFVVERYPNQWDVTSAKVNTLSDQSLKILAELDQPLHLKHFQKPIQAAGTEMLFERYANTSKNFTFEIIDPDLQPQMVQQFGITAYGESVLSMGDRNHKFTGMAEQDVTSAIMTLSKSTKKTIYFIEGHGEPDINDGEERGYLNIAKSLGNEGHEAVRLLLASEQKVPDDAGCLVLAGPQKRLLPGEVEIITEYLNQGGSLLVLLDPMQESGLEPLLGDFGVRVQNTVVVDQFMRLFQGATLGLDPIVETYGIHPITDNFKERTIFPMARSLEKLDNAPVGTTVTELASTSESSWAETSLLPLLEKNEVAQDEGDIAGPLPLALAVEKIVDLTKNPEGQAATDNVIKRAKLVVVGDSDFGNNRYALAMFNTDFFINCVSWLIGEEAQISIRPRSYAPSVFQFTMQEQSLVFYLSVFIIPQLLMMIGIAVMIRRK